MNITWQKIRKWQREDQARWWVTIAASLLLLGLFLMTIFYFYKQGKIDNSALIADQSALLARAIEKIHEQATILNLDIPRIPLTFLNVRSFVGSELGGLTFAHPEKWQGPYLPDNPTVQEKYYDLLKAQDGVYIVPGDGVTVGHGKVMGSDIVLTPDMNLEQVLKSEKALYYQDKPLITRVALKTTNQQQLTPQQQVLLTADINGE